MNPEDEPEVTAAEIGAYIKDVVLSSRRSRAHRKNIPKGTLKALSQWERESTNNYGVVKRK